MGEAEEGCGYYREEGVEHQLVGMSDREQYQKEFDALRREPDDHATYSKYLRGVDNLARLFECAKSVGIEESEAWDIIERGTTADGPRSGVLDLIRVVIERSGESGHTTLKA